MKQSEENSTFIATLDIQHFIAIFPPLLFPFIFERQRSIDYHTRFRQFCQAFLLSFTYLRNIRKHIGNMFG